MNPIDKYKTFLFQRNGEKVVFALKQRQSTVSTPHTAVNISVVLHVILTTLNLHILSDLRALYHSFYSTAFILGSHLSSANVLRKLYLMYYISIGLVSEPMSHKTLSKTRWEVIKTKPFTHQTWFTFLYCLISVKCCFLAMQIILIHMFKSIAVHYYIKWIFQCIKCINHVFWTSYSQKSIHSEME